MPVSATERANQGKVVRTEKGEQTDSVVLKKVDRNDLNEKVTFLIGSKLRRFLGKGLFEEGKARAEAGRQEHPAQG